MNDKCAIDGFGIDVEENMLAEAKQKCPQMDIRLCSCENTPFEDNSFDIIIACMAYHHFPDKKGFALEASRLLKKSGRIYIADPKFPFPIRKFINTALSIHKTVGEFYTEDEIISKFRPFGFEPVDCKSDTYAQIVVLKKTEDNPRPCAQSS